MGRAGGPMEPVKLERIGEFLAVRWADGSETVISLEAMRRQCPCAACAGEPDVTGAVRRPRVTPPLRAESFDLVSTERVGRYALGVRWGDGHRTGLYTWDLLRRLAD